MTRQIIRWQLQMPLQWSDRCTMWSHSCCDQFAEKWQSPSHGARVLGIPWNSVETDSWHSHASAIRPFSAAAIGCTAQIIQNLGQSCLTELCVPEVINAPLDVHILLLSIVMTMKPHMIAGPNCARSQHSSQLNAFHLISLVTASTQAIQSETSCAQMMQAVSHLLVLYL